MKHRLRRAWWPRYLAMAVLIFLSLTVTLAALTGPPPRAIGFRTDPVLRALGTSAQGPEAELVDLAAVPSLSMSMRLVLPLMRADAKRVLKPAPSPPMLAAVPNDAVPPARLPVVAEGAGLTERSLPSELQPPGEAQPRPPAHITVKPPVAAPAPLATAMIMTRSVPQAEPRRPTADARLAIVIDDMGPPRSLTLRAIQLPVPVTMSFLPYAEDLNSLTAAARAHGHEIFLHLPMEPVGTAYPGPNAILVGLDPDEFHRRLVWAFDRVPVATGVNNHMGSRATSDPEIMLKVLQEVQQRGLSFVDSRTSRLSVADGLAAQLRIPHAARDVFLDNDPAPAAVLHQLDEAERLARRRGQALAIGHPRPTTLAVLASWLPAAQARGLKIIQAGELIGSRRCPDTMILQVSACSGPNCPSLCAEGSFVSR